MCTCTQPHPHYLACEVTSTGYVVREMATTLLLESCFSGRIEFVRSLIEGGVSPLVRDNQQNSLIHICCKSEHSQLDMLEYLVPLFINSSQTVSELCDSNGSLPLHWRVPWKGKLC